MLTFGEATAQARGIVGPDATISRHIDKTEGRSAWVEVHLVGAFRPDVRAALVDAGWTHDDPDFLWLAVDPDVPYQEPPGAPALSPLGRLIVDLAAQLSQYTTVLPLSDDLYARLIDEAKSLGWKP